MTAVSDAPAPAAAQARPRAGVPAGVTVWMTGLPSAGKSTLANALAARLRGEGREVEVLDGDEVRLHLSAGLGYSREDRAVNISRIGWVARLLASHGVVTVSAAIAPYADVRDRVRREHEQAGVPFLEVYVSAPVEVCAERDVKGLYAKQRAGEVSGLTGVDDPYEVPQAPDVEVPTHTLGLDESVERVLAALAERGLA
jgi:adenylylsulfate kinase